MPGLTLEQLTQMGAKPQTTTPSQGGGLTLEQLTQMGAKPEQQTSSSVFDMAPKENRSFGEKVGNTAKFIGNDLLTGNTSHIPEAQSGIGRLGRDIFESTVGSRGIAGVAQAPGKAIAQIGALKEQKALAETQMQLANSDYETLQRAKEIEAQGDITAANKLRSFVQDNRASSEQLSKESENLGNFVETPKEVLAKTGNAMLTLASGAVGHQGLTGAKSIAKVAGIEGAIGAGFGVTDPLSQGEEVTAGSVIGGTLGGVLGVPAGVVVSRAMSNIGRRFAPNVMKAVVPGFTENIEQQAVQAVKNNWDKALSKTKSVDKLYQNLSQRHDIADVVTRYGFIPTQDIRTGAVNTKFAIEKADDYISEIFNEQIKYAKKFDDLAKPLEELQSRVDATIRTNNDILNRGTVSRVKKQATQMLEGFRDSYGDNLTPQQQFLIRKQMNADSKAFKANGDFAGADASKIVGDIMRESTNEIGDGVLTKTNQEVGDLLATRQLLNKLHGQKLGAGKLSQHMFRLVGGVLGGTIASGNGITGIIGALGGDAVIGAIRSQAFGSRTKRAIIESLAKNTEAIDLLRKSANKTDMEWFMKHVKKNQKALPAAPVGAKEVKTKIIKEPINLPARTQTTIDAQEIARIQGAIQDTKRMEKMIFEIENEIKDFVPENMKKEAIDVVENNIAELEGMIAINEDLIANSPAKQLMKYTNKRTGELGEVTGGKKSIFKTKGDDIVTELGFEDSEVAREAIGGYVYLRDTTKGAKKTLKDLKSKLKTIKGGKTKKKSGLGLDKNLIKQAKKFDNVEDFVKARGGRKDFDFEDLSKEVKEDIGNNIFDETQPKFEMVAKFDGIDIATGLDGMKIQSGFENVDDLLQQITIQNRTTSPRAVDGLVNILESNNEKYQLDPIIVNGRELIDGGHRLKAYKEVGRKNIPVIDISNIYKEILSNPSMVLDPFEFGLKDFKKPKSQLTDIFNQAKKTINRKKTSLPRG